MNMMQEQNILYEYYSCVNDHYKYCVTFNPLFHVQLF